MIPEGDIGTTKSYNLLIKKLKDFKGYENIERDRVNAGSKYQKKYIIRGITFIDDTGYSPFDDGEQQSLIGIKE